MESLPRSLERCLHLPPNHLRVAKAKAKPCLLSGERFMSIFPFPPIRRSIRETPSLATSATKSAHPSTPSLIAVIPKNLRAVSTDGQHLLPRAGRAAGLPDLWRHKCADRHATSACDLGHDGDQGWCRGLAESEAGRRGERFGNDEAGFMAECQSAERSQVFRRAFVEHRARWVVDPAMELTTESGRPSRGVKKLREIEAMAGKQVVMERQKVIDEEERLDDMVTSDKESLPLETIPGVCCPAAMTWADPSRYRLLVLQSIRTALSTSRGLRARRAWCRGGALASWTGASWPRVLLNGNGRSGKLFCPVLITR